MFVGIAKGYSAISSLLLALKLNRSTLFYSLVTMFSQSKNRSYLPCVVFQTQELNIPIKLLSKKVKN